ESTTRPCADEEQPSTGSDRRDDGVDRARDGGPHAAHGADGARVLAIHEARDGRWIHTIERGAGAIGTLGGEPVEARRARHAARILRWFSPDVGYHRDREGRDGAGRAGPSARFAAPRPPFRPR